MQSAKLSGQPVICQLLSLIPKEIISELVVQHKSDHYYKTMTTFNQFVFMFYGVVGKSKSLNSLCKSLLFLDGKLSYLGIKDLPASSTLSDANRNRSSRVFEDLYYAVLKHYGKDLLGKSLALPINGEADCSKIKRFDSTTFTLFSNIFKGAGRNPDSEKKKGGIKAQTVLAFDSLVPEYVVLNAAANNDKDFLGQLQAEKGHMYVFDKGYINYGVYQKWTEEGVFFVTRLRESAKYTVIKNNPVEVYDLDQKAGVLLDQEIELNVSASKSKVRLRLVTYKDPHSEKLLTFLTNHFEYDAFTIALIYRNRWAIEPFFKQLKQNFLLDYFFSDSPEGIKTQIWIALTANLIFTLIYQRNQEAEQYSTIVAMASSNLGSYVCLITIIKHKKLAQNDRNNKIVQLTIFNLGLGGVFEKLKKEP